MKKYVTNIYSSGPVCALDVAAGKYQDIHNQLYAAAIESFLAMYDIKKEDWEKDYIHLEIRPTDFFDTSVIYFKKAGSKVESVDLAMFWSTYVFKNQSSYDDILMLDDDEKFGSQNEIIAIDYARGEATIFNRLVGLKFFVPLSKITASSVISNYLSSENSFSSLVEKSSVK